jgi:hypothetical protein
MQSKYIVAGWVVAAAIAIAASMTIVKTATMIAIAPSWGLSRLIRIGTALWR